MNSPEEKKHDVLLIDTMNWGHVLFNKIYDDINQIMAKLKVKYEKGEAFDKEFDRISDELSHPLEIADSVEALLDELDEILLKGFSEEIKKQTDKCVLQLKRYKEEYEHRP